MKYHNNNNNIIIVPMWVRQEKIGRQHKPTHHRIVPIYTSQLVQNDKSYYLFYYHGGGALLKYYHVTITRQFI